MNNCSYPAYILINVTFFVKRFQEKIMNRFLLKKAQFLSKSKKMAYFRG